MLNNPKHNNGSILFYWYMARYFSIGTEPYLYFLIPLDRKSMLDFSIHTILPQNRIDTVDIMDDFL